MAMNGNEGGSAYPPNPDVKSGSCLIAGFHALTDIRPSYWDAMKKAGLSEGQKQIYEEDTGNGTFDERESG